MSHGLLWLPLLVTFIGLAWAGWREYQKLEAYRLWAEQFERAKYDIYAVLGQQGRTITWGKPTRRGPTDLQTFSLDQVQTVQLWVNNQSVDPAAPPQRGRKIALTFHLSEPDRQVQIPFTDVELAAQWMQFFQKALVASQ